MAALAPRRRSDVFPTCGLRRSPVDRSALRTHTLRGPADRARSSIINAAVVLGLSCARKKVLRSPKPTPTVPFCLRDGGRARVASIRFSAWAQQIVCRRYVRAEEPGSQPYALFSRETREGVPTVRPRAQAVRTSPQNSPPSAARAGAPFVSITEASLSSCSLYPPLRGLACTSYVRQTSR